MECEIYNSDPPLLKLSLVFLQVSFLCGLFISSFIMPIFFFKALEHIYNSSFKTSDC